MAASADDVNAVDDDGNTALHRAAERGSVLRIHQLVNAGADVEARDEYGATPLQIAVMNEESEAVERLLEAGADIHARDGKGNTALHFAADASNPDLTSLLLQANADANARNDNEDTPIHAITAHASQIGRSSASIETMDLLLHSGTDLNAQDKDGNTALHFVAQGRVPESDRVAEAMLQRGAQLDLINKKGLTALDTAREDRDVIAAAYSRGVKDTIEQYQSHGQARDSDRIPVDPFEEHRSHELGAQADSVSERFAGEEIDHYAEDEQFNPDIELHTSAAAGNASQVDRLLKQGADPNVRDANDRTPLHEAVDARSYETVDRLLAGGANPNLQDALLGQTPLHRACENHDSQIVHRLLESRADPNLHDAAGSTPLLSALESHPDKEPLTTVNTLIAHGAKIDLADRSTNSTPLHLAAATGKHEIADQLLDQRASPSAIDKDGNTPLHIAAGHSGEMTQRLLDAGASPHARNQADFTPLHNAALGNQVDAADRLLGAGAHPNSLTEDRVTPLHMSAYCGAHETTERLIQGGANVHAQDQHGSTPLHNAASANCTKSIDHLLKAGADPRAHVPDKLGTPLEIAQDFGNTKAIERLTQAEHARDSAARSIGQRLFRHVADRIPLRKDAQQSRTIADPDSHHHKEKTMPQQHWSNSKSARQFTEQVVKRVASQVEKGTASFQKGYDKPKGADLQPFNPATGKRFKGLNAIQLKSVAQEKGYSDPRWMSFRTANRVGAKIRKGERGTRVESLRFPPKSKAPQGKDAPEAAAGDKQKEQPRISHDTYVVFNAEQIERMPALEKQLAKEPQQHEICKRAERMIQDSGVKIEPPPNGQNYSNYDKDRDTIVIPEEEKFKSHEAYYGQAVKEMAGRAGHEQQKDRPEPQRHADSRHEMRREMATETIAAKLHLPKPPAGEQYKKQWAETLRKYPNELRYAARDADRMADKVLSHDRPQQRSQTGPARAAVAAPVTPERMQETQRALQQQQPEREMSTAMSR